ncbi:energy-coupling factor transporter ATPase [Dehalobacter sp. DCM]|uniref:ABC transporter ATP-binding protein n=1 Tax=Dehalobacter sp. DCM TaxID=2907827 RepID=UPI00308182C8|nr:energy-coupling factor transporter ATPase [Dehalobacter sp. DCM]
MIKIENLSFRYPTREEYALQNINLEIKKGEFVLLTGSTGCGKTTLLKCLNGIIPHESSGELGGNVWIDGMDTREQPINILAQKVGLVFQNPDEQLFSTRVLDEVAFGLENLCCPWEEMRARIEWALAKVGMAAYQNHSTNALSGGQKQRVAVASLLALQPEILVLDEPISQLDPSGAQGVLEVVKKLSDDGITIILVEHRIHEVAAWADRIVVMDKGRIELNILSEEVGEHLDTFQTLGLRSPRGNNDFKVRLQEAASAAVNPVRTMAKTRKAQKKKDLETPRPALGNEQGKKAKKLVEVSDLWFSYDKKKAKNKAECTLKGLDLNIYAGEIVGVLGENGSGKTTLMQHLAGLHRPQKGRVSIEGKDTAKYDAYRLAGTVGILFQNPSLMLTCDTVYEEVAFGPRNLKMGKEEIAARVGRCLNLMELEELRVCHPQTLSGGQRLRCAASTILSMSPEVILLDEPTSGQDILHIRKLMVLCQELVKQGKAVVMITHDFEIAAEYCDRIIVLSNGNIVLECRPQEILGSCAPAGASLI